MNKIIREIPRKVDCPELTVDEIKIINEICFREDNSIKNCDFLFVFGTGIYKDSAVEGIKKILKTVLIKNIIITGGMPMYEDSRVDVQKSESRLILEAVSANEYPSTKFFLEEESQNSLENVKFGIKIGLENDISFNTITFLFKTHAAGRGYCTLRKFLPKSKILQKTFSPVYPDTSVTMTKSNWYKHQESRNRVWGEILRLREYGTRGDIDISEIKDKLQFLKN